MVRADVLLVSLGSTAGLRAADAELAGALERAGAPRRRRRRRAPARGPHARADRPRAGPGPRARAALRGLAEHRPAGGPLLDDDRRAAVAAARGDPLRRRRRRATGRAATASGSARSSAAACARRRCSSPRPRARSTRPASPAPPRVVVPIAGRAVRPRPATGERDIAALTYAADPHKKGLDRVLAAWAAARRDGEELVVAGADRRVPAAPGVRDAGRLAPAEFRALLRRARVYVTRAAARGLRDRPARGAGRRLRCSSPRPRPGPTPRCRSPARSTRGSSRDDLGRRAARRARRPAPRLRRAGAGRARAVPPRRPSTRRSRERLLPALLGDAVSG